MKRWQPRFDFYEARLNGQRLIVRIDLAARPYAPLVTHQLQVTVSTAMCNPHPDGLRSAEEAPGLFALEDALVAALEREFDAVFAYAAVAGGRQQWTFYVPDHARDNVEATVATCCSPSYALRTRLVDDPQWRGYLKSYPDDRTMHTIMNRRLVTELKAKGDLLTPARRIDHRVFLPSENAAREASAALGKRGFVAAAPPSISNERRAWFVDFSRSESCQPPNPDRWTFEILEIIDSLGGEYDGWGCAVVTS